MLTVLLQLLGAFGILFPAVLIPAAIIVGLGIWFGPWLRPSISGSEAAPTPPAPPIPPLQTILALLAAAFVAAHWATGLQDVWGRGMLTFDTLWYHGPFAARIADTGSVWGMHFTDPLYLNWFYPQNSELLHGAGIVLFDRDILSPFVNFGWLGLALLAAWCIGRPYGVAPTVPGGGGDRDGHGPDGPQRSRNPGDGHGAGRPAPGGRSHPDQCLGDPPVRSVGGGRFGGGPGGRSARGGRRLWSGAGGPPPRGARRAFPGTPSPATSLGAILIAGLAMGLPSGAS